VMPWLTSSLSPFEHTPDILPSLSGRGNPVILHPLAARVPSDSLSLGDGESGVEFTNT